MRWFACHDILMHIRLCMARARRTEDDDKRIGKRDRARRTRKHWNWDISVDQVNVSQFSIECEICLPKHTCVCVYDHMFIAHNLIWLFLGNIPHRMGGLVVWFWIESIRQSYARMHQRAHPHTLTNNAHIGDTVRRSDRHVQCTAYTPSGHSIID